MNCYTHILDRKGFWAWSQFWFFVKTGTGVKASAKENKIKQNKNSEIKIYFIHDLFNIFDDIFINLFEIKNALKMDYNLIVNENISI